MGELAWLAASNLIATVTFGSSLQNLRAGRAQVALVADRMKCGPLHPHLFDQPVDSINGTRVRDGRDQPTIMLDFVVVRRTYHT
jgi:hypothetical protein